MIEKEQFELLNKPINSINDIELTATLNRSNKDNNFDSDWKVFCFEFDSFSNLTSQLNDIDNCNFINANIPSHISFLNLDKPQYVNYQYPWEGLENLVCENFDKLPNKNKCAVYKKKFVISKVDNAKDYIFSLTGFESAAYIYLNGKFVGFTNNNFTCTAFKLNDYLKNGENILNVLVWMGNVSAAGIKYTYTGCDGGFFTVQWCALEKEILHNEHGQVISLKGVVPSYIHQYNRIDNFTKELYKKCRIKPR